MGVGFANALKGDDPTFAPRDARFKVLQNNYPDGLQPLCRCRTHCWVRIKPTDQRHKWLFPDSVDSSGRQSNRAVPMKDAWNAEAKLTIEGRDYLHPHIMLCADMLGRPIVRSLADVFVVRNHKTFY